jgi:small subunit ribosomal protein S10
VDKKSREHFEMRIHKRLIDISDYNNETIEELQKLDLPAGIDVEIQAFGAGGE